MGLSGSGEHFKDNQGSKSPSQVLSSRWTCDTKKCLIGVHWDLLWSPFLQGRTQPGPHAVITVVFSTLITPGPGIVDQ